MIPKFSIIIPLFNKEKHIQKTIESVLTQTFQDYEIIIINDGSTDKSCLIVERFKDSRIKFYSQKNAGAAAARNSGIKTAIGEYISFLDADDYWFPNYLDEVFKLITDFPNCGMYCSRYKIKLSKNHIINTNLNDTLEDNFRGIVPDFFKSSLKFRVALTSAVSIKKELIEKTGFFNEDLVPCEDLDYWIKMGINFPVAITNKITCIYNFENNNISQSNITNHKLLDFKEYASFEKKNKSLKQFIDVYRVEYGLKYKTAGLIEKSNEYLSEVDKKSISKSTKILLQLPPKILQLLLKLKHFARKNGFNFSVYN
jgi:glycosyltransferase involved in cell wall biosynthesis